MPRAKPLSFIPTSTNFSELEKKLEEGSSIDDYLPGKEDDMSELWLETLILTMLNTLRSDRERVILLLQIMRGDGYNFDHQSIARLFGVKLRWYMRIVQRIRKRLAAFNLG
jgi:DNA-directed RNA polymerase specialized sigma24 family protein